MASQVDFAKVVQVLFDGQWRNVKPGSFRIKMYDFGEQMMPRRDGGDGGRVPFAHWEDDGGNTWACHAASLPGLRLKG